MSANHTKHRILKELKYHWEETQHYQEGNLPLGDRSLEIDELSDRLKTDEDKLYDICKSLHAQKYIQAHMGKYAEPNDEPFTFYITDKGKVAVIDKVFLNQVLYRKFDFWKFAIPLAISILALLNSIFGWWSTS